MSEKNFKVGDVVTDKFSDHNIGVVTRVYYDIIYVLWDDGSCGEHGNNALTLKKTDMFLDIERHILSRLRSYK